MPIRIEHSDADGKGIELNADGSISVYRGGVRYDIHESQAAMLKAMILAEAALNRQAQR